jgi:hypothetical protein
MTAQIVVFVQIAVFRNGPVILRKLGQRKATISITNVRVRPVRPKLEEAHTDEEEATRPSSCQTEGSIPKRRTILA